MSDVLSQSEIDNLLAALSSGEVDAEEMKKEGEKQSVKDYDFARPAIFSKEHLDSFICIIICINLIGLAEIYVCKYLFAAV